METRYTRYESEISPLRIKTSTLFLRLYTRHIDLPVTQKTATLYHDLLSKWYDLVTSFICPAQVYKLLVKEAVPANSVMLDLCCGTGNIACAAAEKAREVVGVDASPGMLAKAGEKVEREGIKNIQFILGDVREKLAFADNSFDVVTAGFSVPANIPLFQDCNEKILNETYRVLRENGSLWILTCSHEVSGVYLSGEEYETLFSEAGYRYMEMKTINDLYVIVSARK